MLFEAKLPASFRTYAVRCFVHVHNHVPCSALSGVIPYSLWKKGKKPDVSYFWVFVLTQFDLALGCCLKLVSSNSQQLQPHTRKCIFVGYAPGTHAWTFWDPAEHKFFNSSNAVFDERCFPGNARDINPFGDPLSSVDIPDQGGDDELPLDVPDQGGDDDDDAPPHPPPAIALPPSPSPDPMPPPGPPPNVNPPANPPPRCSTHSMHQQGSLNETALRR
ncbi:hypothetical protein NEOLEDRAFT_1183462 [Neolentinus lepideus HHB14362 ss-1]|uniref:Retroviral polymerase SH3-like domain-containing protein n=1 Tax=Neolentinus lepideus HHB14362 ss-1 TaxID=1314782 RepID=A0A165N9R6_9AGAM|nr:hypothetical protein NEOLEDRAFT_1183462 [Neolentinus lepideus HHB14362 ss-1]